MIARLDACNYPVFKFLAGNIGGGVHRINFKGSRARKYCKRAEQNPSFRAGFAMKQGMNCEMNPISSNSAQLLQVFRFLQRTHKHCQNFLTVDALFQCFFCRPENVIDFWSHGFANRIAFCFPGLVVEHAKERVRCAGAEVLLLAELHELNTSSSLRLVNGQFRSSRTATAASSRVVVVIAITTYSCFAYLDVIALTADRDSRLDTWLYAESFLFWPLADIL